MAHSLLLTKMKDVARLSLRRVYPERREWAQHDRRRAQGKLWPRSRAPILSGRAGRPFYEEDRGAELLEAALVIPLLMMLLLGIVSLGRGYSVYQAMVRAAREGCRELVLTSCATCGNSPYTASSVQTSFVNPALQSAGLDPTKVTNYTSQFACLDSNKPCDECGVAISFNYPYQIVIPFVSINMTTLTLYAQAQMRLENQPGTCSVGSPVP